MEVKQAKVITQLTNSTGDETVQNKPLFAAWFGIVWDEFTKAERQPAPDAKVTP